VPEENHTVTGRLKAVTATILSPDAPRVPTRVTVPSRDTARPPPPSRLRQAARLSPAVPALEDRVRRSLTDAHISPAPSSVRRADYKVEEPHASSYGSNLFKVPCHTAFGGLSIASDFHSHLS
jgi:hypothetical protein